MLSPEKLSGRRSNFSQTCNLLSQYLKEKGSFGDLTLSLTPNSATESKETMDLLPKIEKSGQNLQFNLLPKLVSTGEDAFSGSGENGQLTIFYSGQVLVFNNLPAEKVKEILMLAGKSSAGDRSDTGGFTAPLMAQSPAESATSSPNIFSTLAMQERGVHVPQPVLCSDLPIARKNSLARFLEKRKDRITANAPYQASKPAIKNEPWLGMASQLPG